MRGHQAAGLNPTRRPRDEAEAVGTMEGSRFYPDSVCTHILETLRLPSGHVRAGGSRERLLTPDASTTHRDSLRFLPMHTIRPNHIVGRFREPPARQRLRNTTLVCTISSGYGQPLKAGRDPIGLASEAALHDCGLRRRNDEDETANA